MTTVSGLVSVLVFARWRSSSQNSELPCLPATVGATPLGRGNHKTRNLGIVVLYTALVGCASSSSDITPAYVSPEMYQAYTGPQLAQEAQGCFDASSFAIRRSRSKANQ